MLFSVIALELIGMVSSLVSLVFLLSGDGAREQKLMGYFVCGSLMQNIGYLLELTAPSMEVAMAALKVENFGSLFVGLCYTVFIYSYCYEKSPKKVFRVLAALDFAMIPIFMLCDRHTLFYQQIQWLPSGFGHHYLDIDYGPLYYPMLTIRILIPYVMSIRVLVRAVAKRTDQAVNRQYLTILIISMLPVMALLAFVLKLTQVFDLTPGVLQLALSLVVILIWSRRNYDVHRLAANVLLENMGDGVLALDGGLHLVSYNPAAAQIFPDLSQCRPGESIRKLNDFQDDMLLEDVSCKFDIGSRHFESHTQQIDDQNGRLQGYVILVLDVTETQIYIEEIKRVRHQAEQANRAKSEFLANISHEIRTPMNAIIGLSDVIVEESHGRRLYPYARDVKTAAQNLLAIINDILDLSKVEAGKMELVLTDYHIKGLVGDVVGMMDMAASQRGLKLWYEYDDTIPCCYHGDEGRLKQILINLLNNAVKFTREGHVRIRVGGSPGEEEGTELLTFEIEDTGCGIREEDQSKIFENFKQVDAKRNRAVEGTGLGLSIVKHLIQLMDGAIELHSVYGEGTTFRITIPQKIVDARTLAEAPDPPPKETVKAEYFSSPETKALIVDDNQVNRKVARSYLKSYELDLSEAASGPEAIELVKKQRFDLIFMDHMMPEMDGVEAAAIIRSECGENGTAPVMIALTANAMHGMRDKFLASGFQDFIAKPLNRTAMHLLLTKWIPPERQHELLLTASEDNDEMENLSIPGIDLNALLNDRVGGVKEYIELLELYCAEGRRKVSLLRQLAEDRDYERYGIEVHGLKSASANIGALQLSAMAREHEAAATGGNGVFIEKHHSELIYAYERQLRAIQEYLDRQKEASARDGGPLPAPDPETLVRELQEALALLEDFHSKECAAKISSLLQCSLGDDLAASLAEIQDQLRVYEDDEAEIRLKQLLGRLDKEE